MNLSLYRMKLLDHRSLCYSPRFLVNAVVGAATDTTTLTRKRTLTKINDVLLYSILFKKFRSENSIKFKIQFHQNLINR